MHQIKLLAYIRLKPFTQFNGCAKGLAMLNINKYQKQRETNAVCLISRQSWSNFNSEYDHLIQSRTRVPTYLCKTPLLPDGDRVMFLIDRIDIFPGSDLHTYTIRTCLLMST